MKPYLSIFSRDRCSDVVGYFKNQNKRNKELKTQRKTNEI